jgi:FkbM family methyltransferase
MSYYPISFNGKKIVVDKNVEADFVGGEGPIAAKYLEIKEGEVFFDVGAAWAMWTLYGLACGASVYSFEPSLPHYNNLVKYVEANEGHERCKVFCVGLDKVHRMATLADWYHEHGWHGELTPDCFVLTQFDRLDSFLSVLKRLDWIKMDVEGGELDVLFGGVQALEKFHPNLIIENHANVDQIGAWMKASGTLDKMITFITAMNYTITEEPHQMRSFLICKPKK